MPSSHHQVYLSSQVFVFLDLITCIENFVQEPSAETFVPKQTRNFMPKPESLKRTKQTKEHHQGLRIDIFLDPFVWNPPTWNELLDRIRAHKLFQLERKWTLTGQQKKNSENIFFTEFKQISYSNFISKN